MNAHNNIFKSVLKHSEAIPVFLKEAAEAFREEESRLEAQEAENITGTNTKHTNRTEGDAQRHTDNIQHEEEAIQGISEDIYEKELPAIDLEEFLKIQIHHNIFSQIEVTPSEELREDNREDLLSAVDMDALFAWQECRIILCRRGWDSIRIFSEIKERENESNRYFKKAKPRQRDVGSSSQVPIRKPI